MTFSILVSIAGLAIALLSLRASFGDIDELAASEGELAHRASFADTCAALTFTLTVASTLLALFTSLTTPELLVIYGATILGAWFFALLLGLAQVAGAQSSRRTWRAVGGFYLAGAITLAVVLIDVGV